MDKEYLWDNGLSSIEMPNHHARIILSKNNVYLTSQL